MKNYSLVVGSLQCILLVAAMLLPYRLLALELKRSRCWKQFLQYQKFVCNVKTNNLRIKFLENCKKSDLIPRFLKFRIPNNGCFDEKSVHQFQQRLLNKELVRAKEGLKTIHQRLDEKRKTLQEAAPVKCMPSIATYTRLSRIEVRQTQTRTHNKKLLQLSERQGHPLFNVENTVVQCGLDRPPPSYVLETLSLGPKNAVLDRVEPKDILAELDGLLSYCKEKQVDSEIITDINIKILNYIKKAKKMKSSRNIMLTKEYLKNNNLLAIPFDKGIGICIMKKDVYNQKLDAITNLPQFEKVVKTRKNAKHPILKEEERITDRLKELNIPAKCPGGLLEFYRGCISKNFHRDRLFFTGVQCK